MRGNFFNRLLSVARYTYGCYRKVGNEQLVADSIPAYVRLAIDVAANRARREQIRRDLASQTHALFEDPAAVAEHERFFSDIA